MFRTASVLPPPALALAVLLAATAWVRPAGAGAADLSGRWEGVIRIPGAPMPLVLDLAAGAGSVTLPGRMVSGAPLKALTLGETTVRASLEAAIPMFGDAGPAPEIELERQPDGRLAGTFRLAGLTAPATLQRSGPAQVQPAPASTPIGADLAGLWRGSYELGGYARDVTLTLRAGTPGRAELVIVGKRTTNVPIDRVVQGPVFVSIESAALGLTIDGRWSAAAIEGTLQQGTIEVPLVLHREGGAQ